MQQPRDPGPALLTTPSTPSSSPAVKAVPNNNNNSLTVNNNNTQGASPPPPPGVPSWHPHVYAKPPRSPTPHRIVDILGQMEHARAHAMAATAHSRPVLPAVLPSVRLRPQAVLVVPRVPPPCAPCAPDSPVQDPDEPLNLTTKSRDTSPSGGRTSTPLGLLGRLGTPPPPLRPPGPPVAGGRLAFREPPHGPNGLLALPAGLPHAAHAAHASLNGGLDVAKGGVPTVPPVRVPAVPVRGKPRARRRDRPAPPRPARRCGDPTC